MGPVSQSGGPYTHNAYLGNFSATFASTVDPDLYCADAASVTQCKDDISGLTARRAFDNDSPFEWDGATRTIRLKDYLRSNPPYTITTDADRALLGTHTVTIDSRNNAGAVGQTHLQITVTPAAVYYPEDAEVTMRVGVGSTYSYEICTPRGGVRPFTMQIVGAMPSSSVFGANFTGYENCLTLSITATKSDVGFRAVTVRATDSSQPPTTATMPLYISIREWD